MYEGLEGRYNPPEASWAYVDRLKKLTRMKVLLKGIDSAELIFDNYRVSKDNLVGGVEGLGMKHVLSGLELGRWPEVGVWP